MPTYGIRRAPVIPELQGLWDGAAWSIAPSLEVACWRPEGSDHRPRTLAKLLYDDDGLYTIFRVEDRYVRSVHTAPQDRVYRDSCVELFAQPHPAAGYFNFEWNCGGALLAHYNPLDNKSGASAPIEPEWMERIRVYHSMPNIVDPEIAEPTTWTLEFFIPFGLAASRAPRVLPVAGTTWRGNLYKCGSGTSHPHYASWSPVGGKLSFHQIEFFGELIFED